MTVRYRNVLRYESAKEASGRKEVLPSGLEGEAGQDPDAELGHQEGVSEAAAPDEPLPDREGRPLPLDRPPAEGPEPPEANHVETAEEAVSGSRDGRLPDSPHAISANVPRQSRLSAISHLLSINESISLISTTVHISVNY